MDVHLRDLRYFTVVAQELHFTRAAEQLHISQPALSKQIRALERQLGVELFVRDRREVRLTSAGEALLSHAQSVVVRWDAATSALEEYLRARAATLIIGMSTGPGRGALMPAIRSRFSVEQPAVSLQLRQIDWQDSTAGLADGSTDVAFVWLPISNPNRYRWIVVAEEHRVVAMPDTHPLAARDEIDFTALRDEPLLAVPEAAGKVRDHWLLTELRHGHAARIGATVHNADETYEALVDHRGVVVLAAGNEPLLTRGGIVTRPLRAIRPSRLALAWRRDDTRPAVASYVWAGRQVVRLRTDLRQ